MDERTTVVELLKQYDTAMLVTHDHLALGARPMQVADVEDDGRVWFFTDDRSRKVERVAADRSGIPLPGGIVTRDQLATRDRGGRTARPAPLLRLIGAPGVSVARRDG